MHEQRHLVLAALAPLCLAGMLACSGDSPGGDESSRPPAEGGSTGSDDPGPVPGGNRDGCPHGEPKIGESCPASFGDGSRCGYVLGTCMSGSTEIEITQDYCCFGGLWNQCASDDPAPMCDQLDAAPPPAPREDAAADVGAGDDDAGTPDAGPADAAARDGGEDAGDDTGASDAGAGDDAAPAPDAEPPDLADDLAD